MLVVSLLATGCAQPDETRGNGTPPTTTTPLPHGFGGAGIVLDWQPPGATLSLSPGECKQIPISLTGRSIEGRVEARIESRTDPQTSNITARSGPETYSFDGNGTRTGLIEICAVAQETGTDTQLSLHVITTPQVETTSQSIRVKIERPSGSP